MKGSESFKTTILNYLTQRASEDELFAVKFANPEKKIDDCVDYILGEVQKSGENGFEREEIFGMAVHYYDEDKIEINKTGASNVRVVVDHKVELTAEEIAEAKQKAMDRAIAEQHAKITAKKKPATKQPEPVKSDSTSAPVKPTQASLF